MKKKFAGFPNKTLFTRRDFIKGGALAGTSLFLPAPVSDVIARISNPSSESSLDWLAAIDPIQPVKTMASNFFGDEPIWPHKYLWASTEIPPMSKASESTQVVIIGGGISGLASAYLLRKVKPIIIERAATMGGNARGERWQGIDYSLGGAYIGKLESHDPIMRGLYKPLGIHNLWRVTSDDPVEIEGRVFKNFWAGPTDPKARAAFAKAAEYFRNVLENHYPDIPPDPDSALITEDLAQLDSRSFLDVITDALGSIHPHIRSLLEYYCWSSFDGCASEISAASGLNFFASEFGGVCVLPGGTSKLASQMLKALADVLPKENFLTKTLVTKVIVERDSVYVQCILPDGSSRVINAKAVILACPKFVAGRIIPSLPASQREAINSLTYRSYLVANILLDAPIQRDVFDLYFLDNGTPPDNCPNHSEKGKITDVVVGHFAKAGKRNRSVLTLYHPFPYEGARAVLLRPEAYGRYLEEFKKQLPDIMKVFNVSTSAIRDIRLARWGHPIVLAAKGLLARGTVVRASQSIEKRIFFCNQDNWALPSVETCLSVALNIAPQVEEVLR